MQLSLYEGLYIEVYRNLHKKCWSVRHKGRVIWHTNKVTLKNAKLVVQPAGNDRTRREKVKNVHAFVRGYLTWDNFPYEDVTNNNRISYNPYFDTSFVNWLGCLPVYEADMVLMDMDLGTYIKRCQE